MKLEPIEKAGPQINLVPILDSIFILIFIFMIALVQRVQSSSIKLSLPKTSSKTQTTSLESLTLEVSESGELYLQGHKMAKRDLKRELELIAFEKGNSSLLIKGDKNVNLGLIIELLGIAKTCGIKNVDIETLSQENEML